MMSHRSRGASAARVAGLDAEDQPQALAVCAEAGFPLTVPPDDQVLRRALKSAGLPTTGRFRPSAGWVSQAWIGDDYVVRVNIDRRHRCAFQHEARVVGLLSGSGVPHARLVGTGEGPDGPWYVSERLPGRTLHEAWPGASPDTRRSMIESLGAALHDLHQVEVPTDLLPPWLAGALSGEPWPSFHPPVVHAALQQVEAARRLPTGDTRLLADVAEWIRERLPLFTADPPALVHGDIHGSNVIVHEGRVTGLIDFAEALSQPADAELDTILRWCARPHEYPPTPSSSGLSRGSLDAVPRWLVNAYPDLFAREHLRERLHFYDLCVELALHLHHPQPVARKTAEARLTQLLAEHDHLGRLEW